MVVSAVANSQMIQKNGHLLAACAQTHRSEMAHNVFSAACDGERTFNQLRKHKHTYVLTWGALRMNSLFQPPSSGHSGNCSFTLFISLHTISAIVTFFNIFFYTFSALYYKVHDKTYVFYYVCLVEPKTGCTM